MAISTLTGTGTTTVKVGDLNSVIAAINTELTAIGARIGADDDDLAALNNRLTAIEALVQRAPTQPSTTSVVEVPPRPPGLDTTSVQLIYNQAVLYYRDVELHAQRIGERRWRLQSRLNYIVISPAEWTYEEIVEGTPEQVYEHATRRLMELAELKPQHDAVHDRVKQMSEGRS